MHAQLGFCGGNSGDPIFSETFGTGTTNTTLPAGTTTYAYSNGFPNDGFYTVRNGTFGNSFDWHQTEDHTLGDVNGKCLIVNASSSAGEFYRTTVNGLCENTTYEFSAWLINLVIAGSYCSTQPSGAIPINVRFEIWDITDTNLLANGDTGNIFDSNTPNWEQYALVFQTLLGQNGVILKMINNGAGGCGNDLAIDDIVFKSCGDFITIEDASNNNNATICSSQTPYTTSLTVTPDNSIFSTHFYQWQESTDGITWSDLAGETNQNITITGIATTMYYRAKVAESVLNVNNSSCNTISEVYQLTVNQAPTQPTLECWETATFSDTTCSWNVTGTQPTAPTGLECWETATFNNTTCVWDVTGTQPVQPTLECWETATFNNATCVWDVTGTQPTQPTLECWETATFNNSTCVWDVTGTQPAAPTGLECWETTSFNNTTCVWDITGTQTVNSIEEFLSFCSGEDITMQASTDILNPTFLWDTGEITEFKTVSTPGTYSVETTDGCLTTIKTIYVEELQSPIIDTVASDGNYLIITTSNQGNFEYSLDGNTYQLNNTFSNIAGGLYTVYVKELNDCGITSAQYLHFVIPKFFTPNNDGENDAFELKGIENFNSSQVYIFDRYGKLLKSSTNSPFAWTGTFNNQLLSSDDYWYIIIIDGQQFNGNFTLKR